MPVNASSGFSSVVPPISPTLAVVAVDAGGGVETVVGTMVVGAIVVGNNGTADVLVEPAAEVVVLAAIVVLDCGAAVEDVAATVVVGVGMV